METAMADPGRRTWGSPQARRRTAAELNYLNKEAK